MSLIVLTGNVRTGKTTWLKNILPNLFSCGGILTPDREGLRHIYHIETGEWISFEVPVADLDTIDIGKFHFLKNAFILGAELVIKSLQQNRLTIVDEFGRLEFTDDGFAPYLNEVILQNKHSEKILLVVVRNSLLQEFIIKFNEPDLILDFSKNQDSLNVLLGYLDHLD